jgi:hypothetical protein
LIADPDEASDADRQGTDSMHCVQLQTMLPVLKPQLEKTYYVVEFYP